MFEINVNFKKYLFSFTQVLAVARAIFSSGMKYLVVAREYLVIAYRV